jgi:proton glutamate symport protein
MVKHIQKLLVNPFVLLAALFAAIFVGIKHPEFARNFDQIGGYYISLLKMIVLPYLFVTITAGIARVASDSGSARYTRRLVFTYPLAMVFTAVLAVGACFLIPPAGQVDRNAMISLGNILTGDSASIVQTDSEVTFSVPHLGVAHDVGHPMLDRFVPNNIFAALTDGDSLKVVIFCIFFGAALARHSDEGSRSLLDVFLAVQLACVQVIHWLNLLLPFALFSMVSTQVASVGIGPLISLGPFVLVQILTGLTLVLISALVIARRARVSPLAAIFGLRQTIILAITTRSSFACIPVAVRELSENLHFNRFGTGLVMPLGATICRIGSVPYFVIGTIFIAQVYGVELNFQKYMIIVAASVAAGFASSGATGAVGVVLISIVVGALNLPVEAAVALFIAVDPIIDVVRTLVLVYGNCALTALITPNDGKESEPINQAQSVGAAP